MSTPKHAADRQKMLAKNNTSDSGPGEPATCISKNLFEHPVSRIFHAILGFPPETILISSAATKPFLSVPNLLQPRSSLLDIHVEDCLRAVLTIKL